MDRLFRKKSSRTSEKLLNSSKRKSKQSAALSESSGDDGSKDVYGEKRVPGVAPSLDVDIRNSLILPSLSQRFSVLLPPLATAPEDSIRTLLASQRARIHGPALTEEEEELLFAELRASERNEWYRMPPKSNCDDDRIRTPNSKADIIPNPVSPFIETSAPSPSINVSDDGQSSPLHPGSSPLISSPPPTSNSFSSFKTFGVASSPEQPTLGSLKSKELESGMGGSMGLRENAYLRRAPEQGGTNDLKYTSGKSRGKKEQGDKGDVPTTTLMKTATDHDLKPQSRIPDSSMRSESTMASLSSVVGPHSHATPIINTLRPDLGSPELSNFAGQPRQRYSKSLLSELTPAQIKRISMALEEIGGQLKRGGNIMENNIHKECEHTAGDEEEVLASGESQKNLSGNQDEMRGERPRRPSDVFSEGSRSATSSVFPFKTSPTNSTFTGRSANTLTNTDSASPSRLPSSPRSHNLRAVVNEDIPPVPESTLTPTRLQPVKANSILSNASAASTPTPSLVLHNPAYVPGQPRPIRPTHHGEGSLSSRAATPNGQPHFDILLNSRSVTPDSQSPPNTLRSSAAYSDATQSTNTSPSPLLHYPISLAKATSLSRSYSVNQASLPIGGDSDQSSVTRRRAGTITLGETESGRGLNFSSEAHPFLQREIVEEEEYEHEEEQKTRSREHLKEEENDAGSTLELKEAINRHSLGASWYDPKTSIDEEESFQNGHKSQARDVVETAIFSLDALRTDDETAEGAGFFSPIPLQRLSCDSLDSVFDPKQDVPQWIDIFDGNDFVRVDSETDDISDWPEKPELLLEKITGLGVEELMLLQEELVTKARREREAMGLGFSPLISDTPTIPKQYCSLKQQSPRLNVEGPPAVDARTTNPMTMNGIIPVTSAMESSSSMASQIADTIPCAPQRPVLDMPPQPLPAPPTQEVPNAESFSSATRMRGNVIDNTTESLETEKEKDFRTRIAAATAALNRNPSIQGARLERKNTKRGAAMVISSPKLLSSTAKVPTHPLTPPDHPSAVDSILEKSLEKMSGSGSKMSQKWKKLMKKGPSVSSSEAFKPVHPMSAANSGSTDPNSIPQPAPVARLQRSNSQSVSRTLGAPIQLRQEANTAISLSSAPPDLKSFQFPRRIDQREGSNADQKTCPAMTISQVPTRVITPPNTTVHGDAPLDQLSERTQSPTQDTAILNFLQAGRQLGLKEDQLKAILVQKEMLNDSDTIASKDSALPNSEPVLKISPSSSARQRSPTPIWQAEKAIAKQKKEGLFRSLSKKARELPIRMRTPEPPQKEVVTPVSVSRPLHDKVVLRRTMIFPDGLTPSAFQMSSDVTPGSPSSSNVGRQPSQRKLSIRRKPLNLSKEDRELVSNSPPAHQTGFGSNASPSQKHENIAHEDQNFGFVYRNPAHRADDSTKRRSLASMTLSRRSLSGMSERSSTAGSLIDMYGDDRNGGEEMLLKSPPLDRDSRIIETIQNGPAQAVEICEYADGQVVWSVVDALRTSVAASVDENDGPFGHRLSQSSSNYSANKVSVFGEKHDYFTETESMSRPSGANIAPLNVRHIANRKSIIKPRPPTDVYFTSSHDVADLIDHLSRDLEASRGRIDIISSHDSSVDTDRPFHHTPFNIEQHRTPGSPSSNSQFEDAPSPAPPPRRIPFSQRIHPRSPRSYHPASEINIEEETSLKHHVGHQIGRSSNTNSFTNCETHDPSSRHFANSSHVQGKSLEYRLQELMDRMRNAKPDGRR